MDNLEPRELELHTEVAPVDQRRMREEIRPASKQDVELYIRT
jgi:hypothetical protein